MTDQSPPVDPRYRPEFQRGYRAEPAPVSPQPDASRPMAEPVLESRVADQRVTQSPAIRPIEVKLVAAEPARIEPMVARLLDPDGEPGLPPVRSRQAVNPYLVLAAIVGTLSTIVGASLTIQQAFLNYTPGPGASGDNFLRTFTYVFGEPLVAVGLATLVGLVFFIAAKRRS